MLRVFALLLLLPFAACVSDQQAVDMGLATACDGKGVISQVGDPSGRYVVVQGGESCKGPKRNTYDTRKLTLIDCKSPARLEATVAQISADQVRRGSDFDHSTVVDAQKARLRLGLTDLAGVQSALMAAGVPVTLTPGISGEECTRPVG